MAGSDVLERLLRRFPRAVADFDAVSLHVSGAWDGVLVQLVYSRRDPCRPGHRATLVAAHHADLGSLSYEVVDGDGLLSVDEWARGTTRRTGIWWTTATAESTRGRREAMLWHDVLPVVEQVDTLAAAARVAEHLNVPLSADVRPRPPRLPAPRGTAPGEVTDEATDEARATCEIDRLERLLALVDGVVADLVDSPDVSRELHAARSRVETAIGVVRAAS